ncbi:putative peptidylprolyl isomerase CWC27 Ecym_1176 [Eremothecium cymbalariae DBVPG|uniref:PPIase cyclophilin-type domain-containing protein n=1 Tax=Eremothecium cymbalariae (strain CBS 270.75 / DBVPG 7215 / KCTC 17166 / NRRL Y-17582) TaxID=931890 RepID=G8JMW2_ERECY|nr:hypothetical protein Ecym_1176 [Eremothecium cymbalariae DBVPG\
MSSEPSTSAKCVFHTTKGDLEVELWARECAVTTKRFLESAGNGLWKGKAFSKLGSSLIQVGFSTFKCAKEYNGRLRFNRRGLLGIMPGNGVLFFTLEEQPSLNDDAVLFGTLVGNSFYTLLGISQGELEEDGEKFLYPATIDTIDITVPYFNDLATPVSKRESHDKTPPKATKKRKIGSKIQLTYEDEEEDEDSESNTNNIKIRAAHDVLASDGNFQVAPLEKEIVEEHSDKTGSIPEMELENMSDSYRSTGSSVVDDIEMTERERSTLSFLNSFQTKFKDGMNPLY